MTTLLTASAQSHLPGHHGSSDADAGPRASLDAALSDFGPAESEATHAALADAGPTDAHGAAAKKARRTRLPRWPVALETEVVRFARGFDGELAFYVKDLSDGSVYSYNGETPFYLASVVKIAVLREVYRQLDAGRLALDELLTLSAEAVRDGSGLAKSSALGARFSVSELLKRMIHQSDNAAADLLIERVGLDRINAALDAMGGFGEVTSMLTVRHLVYGRLSPKALSLTPGQIFELAQINPLEERARALGKAIGEHQLSGRDLARAFEAYYADLLNSASMSAVVRLLESLHRCEGLSASSCRAIIETLKHCETGEARLKAQLPPGLAFAHKTGTQHRRICDVGLLYLPGKPIAIAACAKDFQSMRAAEVLFAQLGKATLRALAVPATTAAQQAHSPIQALDAGAPEERVATP
jgi:beta-lactamase class A